MFTPDFPLPDGYLWQYAFLRWLQMYATPELDKIAKWLSTLGVEGYYIVLVLPVLFWSINKKLGLRVAYVYLLSTYSNVWLKEFFHIARPVGVPGIRSLYTESATGLSMPSGHAQGPMTFWLLVYKWVNRKWLLAPLLLLVFAIGLSRLYLGLHWPADMLVGWGLGLLFGLFGWWIGQWWSYRAYAYQIRMTFAIALPAMLLMVQNGLPSAEYAALLLGIGVGATLESRYLGVDIDPALWKRACAAVIGMAGLVALQWVVKWPVENTFVAVVKDVLIGLWGTFGAPYVFYKCGLYRQGDSV